MLHFAGASERNEAGDGRAIVERQIAYDVLRQRRRERHDAG